MAMFNDTPFATDEKKICRARETTPKQELIYHLEQMSKSNEFKYFRKYETYKPYFFVSVGVLIFSLIKPDSVQRLIGDVGLAASYAAPIVLGWLTFTSKIDAQLENKRYQDSERAIKENGFGVPSNGKVYDYLGGEYDSWLSYEEAANKLQNKP